MAWSQRGVKRASRVSRVQVMRISGAAEATAACTILSSQRAGC